MNQRLNDRFAPPPRRAPRRRAAIALVAALLLASSPALADGYDSDSAGHPLRIAAYVLHPIGVIIETLILKPAHWLGHQEPIRTLVGHEEE
jgi:hypothetical protein